MLSWVDVNFKVLVNSKDEKRLKYTINSFLYELNNSGLDNESTRIGGVSEVTYSTENIEDKEFEDMLNEYFDNRKEDNK